MSDQNVEDLRAMLKDRAAVGFKKYGVTTMRTDLTAADWCQHAIEESLDHAVYLRALKRELESSAASGPDAQDARRYRALVGAMAAQFRGEEFTPQQAFVAAKIWAVPHTESRIAEVIDTAMEQFPEEPTE